VPGLQISKIDRSVDIAELQALELVPATQVFVNISEEGKCLSSPGMRGSHVCKPGAGTKSLWLLMAYTRDEPFVEMDVRGNHMVTKPRLCKPVQGRRRFATGRGKGLLVSKGAKPKSECQSVAPSPQSPEPPEPPERSLKASAGAWALLEEGILIETSE